MKDYSKLKELLETQETFPHLFTFKFIGRNTPLFEAGIAKLKTEHSGLSQQSRRESSGGAHLAMTYTFSAQTADEIIEILKRISKVEDVLVVL